jgi:intein-encoded DNA endonuclease-like protein
MYLRGFFDAEGGIPRNGKRFYIQLAQKDYEKMTALKKMLSDIGIEGAE